MGKSEYSVGKVFKYDIPLIIPSLLAILFKDLFVRYKSSYSFNRRVAGANIRSLTRYVCVCVCTVRHEEEGLVSTAFAHLYNYAGSSTRLVIVGRIMLLLNRRNRRDGPLWQSRG